MFRYYRHLQGAHTKISLKHTVINTNFVLLILGDSPVSQFYVPTFRNTLFHLHRRCKQESPKGKNATLRTQQKFEIKNKYVICNKRISNAIRPSVSRSSSHITAIPDGVARSRGVCSEEYERHCTSKVWNRSFYNSASNDTDIGKSGHSCAQFSDNVHHIRLKTRAASGVPYNKPQRTSF